MLLKFRALGAALCLLLALGAPSIAEAAAKVRVDFITVASNAPNQPSRTYASQALTVSGTATQTQAAPVYGSAGTPGFARVTVLSGAVIVAWGDDPTAAETVGVRLEQGADKLIQVPTGQKLSIIEAADAPAGPSLPSGAATSANQTTANSTLTAIDGHVDGLETLVGATNTKLDSVATNTTGLATAANQTTANSSLSAISGKLPSSLGPKTAANSLSVAPASDAVFSTSNDGVTDGVTYGADSVSSAATLRTVSSAGFGQAIVQFTSAGSGNTGVFEGSNDGTNWFALRAVRLDTGQPFYASGFTVNTLVYVVRLEGAQFRVRLSGYGSGTVTAYTVLKRAPTNVNVTSLGLFDVNGLAITAISSYADDMSNSSSGANAMMSYARGSEFDGTTWDRARTIQGADGTGSGVRAVATAPMSSAAGAISNTTPAGNGPTSAAAGSLVACSAACNGYKVDITTGASAGYLLVFDATSAPADGTVTPALCVSVAATTTASVTLGQADIPARFATGLTAVFSTTGCFTKTASATAFIRVLAK